MKTHYEEQMEWRIPALEMMRKLIDENGTAGGAARALQRANLQATPGFFPGYIFNMVRLLASESIRRREARPDDAFKALLAHNGANEYNVEGLMVEAQQLVWHEMFGRKVYEIDPGLADKLKHTELRGITGDELKLPYEGIYVAIPPEAGLWGKPFGGVQRLCLGAYIAEIECRDIPGCQRQWSVFLAFSSAKGGDNRFGECGGFCVDLRNGQAIDNELVYWEKKEGGWVAAMFRFLMNVVLYATSPDVDAATVCSPEYEALSRRHRKAPHNSTKRERLRQELRGLDPQRRIVLGRGVAYEPAPKGADGSPISVRFRVAGHWRWQPVGARLPEGTEGPQNAKRIWVSPYWKGPTTGLLTNVIHRLVAPAEVRGIALAEAQVISL